MALHSRPKTVKSGITVVKHAHPRTPSNPPCQGWHTEWGNCRSCQVPAMEKCPHSSLLPTKGPGLWCPEHSWPERSMRVMVTGKTKHCPSPRIRDKTTERAFWPQSFTHSLDRAWLFWNSSSGNMCSWFRFSRLKREERKSWKSPWCPGDPKTFQKALDSEGASPGFKSYLTGSLCNPREITFSRLHFLHL